MGAAAPLLVVGAQAGAAWLGATLKLGAAASGLLVGAVTVAAGYAVSSFAKKAQDGQTDLRANYVSTTKTIPLIYGKVLVGSNDVFAELGIKDGGGDGKKYLWVVHAISEGEIEGFNQIDIDGTPQDEIYIDGKGAWEFKTNKVEKWLLSGTNTQAANTNIYEGTSLEKGDKLKGSKFNETMRNTAYIVFRFQYKGKGDTKFTGIPKREVVIKGIKCYDPRTTLTTWTTNPVLALLDYMTNERYGLGWSLTKFDLTSFNECANYCDEIVYEGTDKRWEINLAISNPTRAQEAIDTILAHFRGALRYYDGKLYLKCIGKDVLEEPPAIDFYVNQEHIARSPEGSPLVGVSQPSSFSVPDGIAVNYVNARDNWTEDRAIIGEASFNDSQVNSVNFYGFTSRRMALNMGTYLLERERLNRVVSFGLRPDAIALDPEDLISVTIPEIGYNDQLARVKTSSVDSSGIVSITAILEAESLYDADYDEDTSEVYEITLPSVSDDPPSVENVVIVEEQYLDKGRTFTRLNVSFDFPDFYLWFSHVDVYTSIVALGDAPPSGEADYRYRFSANDDFQIDPAQEGYTYYFRLSSVSTYGVKQEYEDSVFDEYYVEGVTETHPGDVTNFKLVVNQTSVDMVADPAPFEDILGYEFRLGDTWNESIFIAFKSSPDVSFNSVKPGTHNFWLGTKHKNGYYSTSPQSDDDTIDAPPIGTKWYQDTVVDYLTGTKDNVTTTATTIKVTSHAGTPFDLDGEYLSPEIVLDNPRADQRSLVYVDFTFVLDEGTDKGEWAGLAPPPVKWADLPATDITSVTWEEFVGYPDDPDYQYKTEACKIEVSVGYSTVSGGPYTYVDRMELLSAIIRGKYVKVRYKITDKSYDSFLTINQSTLKAHYLEETLVIDA